MLKKLRYILLKPITLSVLLGAIVIAFIPDFFEKYIVEKIPVDVGERVPNEIIHSADMDGDGNDEFLITYEYEKEHSIQVCTYDGGIIDQWNTKVKMPVQDLRIGIGDYDNDGFGEFYSFGDRNDSIFLFAFEPLDTINPLWINNIFLTTLSRKYNDPDYIFNHIEVSDITSDGNPDIFFIINSGQARIPRNLYIYDIKNDTLLTSPIYGTVPSEDVWIQDLNDDGRPEIFGNNQAAGQIIDSLGIIYSDYSAWVMLFNNNLDLVFNPIEYPGFRSKINVQPISIDNSNYILTLYNHQGRKDNYPELSLLDYTGEVLKRFKLNKSSKKDRWLYVSNKVYPSTIFLISQTGKIIELDTSLRPKDSLDLGVTIRSNCLEADLNGDGIEEKIFHLDNDQILIAQSDFGHPATIGINDRLQSVEPVKVSGVDYLFVQSGDEIALIKYLKNPLYIFRYVIYIGIIILIYLFITFIRKLHLIQIQKRENINSQILELQLKSFKNQMDPHFTFNVFNTLAHKIHKESPESYGAFMEFSNLIRKTLLASDSISRPIRDEVSKLESYLKLEQMRYGDTIKYKINISDDVDQNMHIPKLILQTYVENAIKHGIRPKPEGGIVKIMFKMEDKVLVIQIMDNGIGREKSKELKTQGTGFGLRIMANYISLFNESNRNKIRQEIIDIKEDNKTGTLIKISIPVDFKYPVQKL